MTKKYFILLISFFVAVYSYSQAVPSSDEKFPYLCTFSKNSMTKWGDDDFSQTYFFVVPETEKTPFYIRIFDADIGGENDEMQGSSFNSQTRYAVYGGKGAHSEPDAQKTNPMGNYKKGILLTSKNIGTDASADNKWITLGPFNPVEGELQTDLGGYVFKLIIEGQEGDDGNMYKMFLSSMQNENKPVTGGNTFTYEYCLRLSDIKSTVGHLYPFITSNIIAVKIHVFDYDNDGVLRIISISKKGISEQSSGDNVWKETFISITPEEINTSLDIQFIKETQSKNNNMVVYITNQYGQNLPFYSAPIGGVPKYSYKIKVKPAK